MTVLRPYYHPTLIDSTTLPYYVVSSEACYWQKLSSCWGDFLKPILWPIFRHFCQWGQHKPQPVNHKQFGCALYVWTSGKADLRTKNQRILFQKQIYIGLFVMFFLWFCYGLQDFLAHHKNTFYTFCFTATVGLGRFNALN